jgi:hypothetical protein
MLTGNSHDMIDASTRTQDTGSQVFPITQPNQEEKTTAVKARFWVQKVTKQAASGGSITRIIELAPVIRSNPLPGAEGNIDWSKYTPSGSITLTVSKDGAGQWFEDHLGRDVAITFDAVDD